VCPRRAKEAAGGGTQGRKLSGLAGNFRKLTFIAALDKVGTIRTRAKVSRPTRQYLYFGLILVKIHTETGNEISLKALKAGRGRTIDS
jgi:hypothetical protein